MDSYSIWADVKKKDRFIFALFNHEEMLLFDTYVKAKRPDIYRKMGMLLLKPAMPIPYVAYWRMFGRRFPVDGIRNLYRRLRYGRDKG